VSAVSVILVNRAPFLTLWAKVVALRLGYDEETALTLGRAVAGQTAAAKGKRLGILEARPADERQRIEARRSEMQATTVEFMGRTIPCLQTKDGLRALADARPIDPQGVRTYLAAKFGEDLVLVEGKLATLAASIAPAELDARAMDLYMSIRPATAGGRAGWGQAGRLDLDAIDRLATRPS
jgi:hypothetical protein